MAKRFLNWYGDQVLLLNTAPRGIGDVLWYFLVFIPTMPLFAPFLIAAGFIEIFTDP